MNMNFSGSTGGAPKMPNMKINSGVKRNLVCLLVTIVVGLLYFYVSLPAINLKATEFYSFIFMLCLVYFACTLLTSGFAVASGSKQDYWHFIKTRCKVLAVIVLALAAVYLVGHLIGWPVFRANAYHNLLTVDTGDFTKDVEEISYNQIPRLDTQSAIRLGDRKLGELSDMVSQFEVNHSYTQINYLGRPVRVTYLDYGDFFKWWNNRAAGIPAYIVVDMITQEVEVVRPEERIKYSPSEYFTRDLNRYLRFHYPTYMFDIPTFEIDEEGVPYWVVPRVSKTIGLFGGKDIIGAVLLNAATGECQYLELGTIPSWMDRVFTAELIIQQYDYHGLYINGFINSLFGQTGVTATTEGSNYIAIGDDVYMYTGITSVGRDESNIGFILSNQRTKETRYYNIPGAEEYSAVASAEGVVQDLGYTATFPILLNIAGEPTYFMALKDSAQLVKLYAMVNERQYQIVAVGDTVAACEQEYHKLLLRNNVVEDVDLVGDTVAEGSIAEIRSAVVDGTTQYFLRLDGERTFYRISAADSETAVLLNVGDRVEIEHDVDESRQVITAFNVRKK